PVQALARFTRTASTCPVLDAGSSTCDGRRVMPRSSSITSPDRPPTLTLPHKGGGNLAQGHVHVGSQVAHRLPDPAVERRIRVNQVPEIIDRNLVSDGELKDAEDVAAARSHGGCPDENASVGIRDDLDQPVIAGTVDPAAGGD